MLPVKGDEEPVELDFVSEVVGLRRRIQSLYDETRSLTQQSKWEDHLSQAVLLLGCFQYLGWNQWISRILGRMAWSYIRLGEFGHAKRLLRFSEGYHIWQSGANYYWASEYSSRSNHESWAREFIAEFRAICRTKLALQSSGDLELAVTFYEALVHQESTDTLFSDINNQSDLGRYLELRGRLNADPRDFWDAAQHYDLAGLHSYASFNRAFHYFCLARQACHSVSERKQLYERALKEVTEQPIFADIEIKELIECYLEARICCCDLLMNCELIEREPSTIREIEKSYEKIHFLIRGSRDPGDSSKSMTGLAAKFVSLSTRLAWKSLLDFVDSLDPIICSAEMATAGKLNDHLDHIQPFLPSLSFLTT